MGILTIEDKMKMVMELAEEGIRQGEIPIAAIIFDGDTIISKAYTSEKKDKRYLVHAELKALLEMDKQGFSPEARRQMQLFTNLEPCMMCLGATIHSFVGEVYYSLESPTDGGAVWMEKTWADHHIASAFQPPRIYSRILEEKSRGLFERYLENRPQGSLLDWVKTLI